METEGANMGEELAELRTALATVKPRIIGVDGMNGVGKTHRIAKPLGLPTISLDTFLIGEGKYLEGFRLDDLAAAVMTHAEAPVVIEGCCLLAVLEKINVRPDLHVYARRVSSTGWWEDEEVAVGEDRADILSECQRTEAAIAQVLGRQRRNTLEADLIVYHTDFRPFQNADLILDIVER